MGKTGPVYIGVMRVVIVAFAVLAQLFLLISIVELFKQNFYYAYILLEVFSVFLAIILISNDRNYSYTMLWLLVILIMPVFGYLLYMLWGRTSLFGSSKKKNEEILTHSACFLVQDPAIHADSPTPPARKRITTYLQQEGFPLFANTACSYFPSGESQFEKMLEDMEGARHFIFLEYFIVAEGQLWERIHEVLRRKAAQGVEVRLIYDDFGSITTMTARTIKQLKKENIQVINFNPVHRYISKLYINYRNHKKITVIDGNIGYTGGTNIADEYVNLRQRYGYWKDNAIRLEGEAVWSLTVIFLQMWEFESNTKSVYTNYTPTLSKPETKGFYQPFCDGPSNNPHNPAAAIYQQIIANASEYVYLTTPYLVIDNAIKEVLCIAAKSGIDVRIITPRISDHWFVHIVTQSNYGDLLEAGVRIYEYTPGYIHAKTIISDDDNAVVGSINLDYRSFYLHYENGVWICGAPVLAEIKKDILDIIAKSEEVALAEWKARPWHIKLAEPLIRLFGPLF